MLSVTFINNYKLIDGSYNAAKLKDFLEKSWSNNKIQPNDVLVMDNVRLHHSESVKDFVKKNIVIKYLPPYSPDVFSILKYRDVVIRPSPVYGNMIKEYVAQMIDSMIAYDLY